MLSLSDLRCQALFLNFRDKIVLLLYYSLNTIVQLKVRMRAFKILLRVLDVLLFFKEKDLALIEVLNRSIEFSLFEKSNNPKFSQNQPNNNYSLQDFVIDHRIQKEISREIYGEWIKQIQEGNRNFVEDKLLNVKKIFFTKKNTIFLVFLQILARIPRKNQKMVPNLHEFMDFSNFRA